MERNELDSLKADLRRMQARVEELETNAEEPTNRRNMLRGLGAAAVGAAAGGLAFARPAAANDGVDINAGALNTSQSPTTLQPTTSWSSSPLQGAFSVTNDPTFSNSQAALSMISAYADSDLVGGFTTGVVAASKNGTGAKLDGPTPLKLLDSANTGAPGSGGRTGQFRLDSGDLWFCTFDNGLFGGENAQWRKITGETVAGAFHAITPIRCYDSRQPGMPSPGVLASNASRTISLAASRTSAGVIINANAVPAKAKAVMANITVTATGAPGGFLSVNPGGDISQATSAINWFGASQNLANGLALTMDGSRQVTVVCGAGGGSTHFLIDVSGYFL